MFITPILSIFISLLLVWAAMSLVVMFCHEWLASRLSWRAKMLEATVRNMLSDSALADQLYNHPLIRSLYSGENAASKPSYIPASQFAQALLDIVVGAPSEASLIQHYLYKLRWELLRLDKKWRAEAQKRINIILALTRRVLVSQLDENAQSAALDEIRAALTSLGEDYPDLKISIESMLTTVSIQQNQIRETIKSSASTGAEGELITVNRYKAGLMALSVTHPRLKQILGALLSELSSASAETEASQFRARQNVEDWFNNSMDRLSGWYRRRSQALAYSLAIILAFFLNVDSIHLATILWQDAYTRGVLVEKAEQLVQANPDGYGNQMEQAELEAALVDMFSQPWYSYLPVGWIGFPEDVPGAGQACGNQEISQVWVQVWNQCYPLVNLPASNTLASWAVKVLGTLITGIAAAQGAPFWFDVLKKMINVRMSGANPGELKRAVG